MEKYRNFVRSKARCYFLVGADYEDLVQEGMIGLYKAIRDFQGDKPSSFRTFAELCITRQIITAIKKATRQKHIPLNSYVSLDKPAYEHDADRTLYDTLSTSLTNPENVYINREGYNSIRCKIHQVLSELERHVLILYSEGFSYQEIGRELGKHTKAVDNALQRVKKKLGKILG